MMHGRPTESEFNATESIATRLAYALSTVTVLIDAENQPMHFCLNSWELREVVLCLKLQKAASSPFFKGLHPYDNEPYDL